MWADLFCQVIDNYGDIGVTWRLARQLQHEHHVTLRLWVDDLETFARIEPLIHVNLDTQYVQGIEIRQWSPHSAVPTPYPVVITSFCCNLPAAWLRAMAVNPNQCWVELEYLSAESWVASHHLLHSKRADGLSPTFFYPGFTTNTAGLIREQNLIQDRNLWQADIENQDIFLKQLGVSIKPRQQRPFLVSLFTYQDAPIQALFNAFEHSQSLPDNQNSICVLVPEGVLMPESLKIPSHVSWQRIPFLSQPDYDRLLWSMHLNIVRGEDSFVRAQWAGKPMIWHIYPQTENTHLVKLHAWLAQTDLPQAVKEAMVAWSTSTPNASAESAIRLALNQPYWSIWQKAAQKHTNRLALLPDLASNLVKFCIQQTKNADSG